MRYTIKDFKKDFPDDKACLAHIFKKRYPEGLKCPKCGKSAFHPVANRRSYACACGYQTYPTEGTIFHKSPTPLTMWFHAIFMMSQSKNGVAAKELERHLGVTYKCAWRIAKQIRMLMKQSPDPLDGKEIIELDETYIGGVRRGKRGRGAAGKTPVFGAVERKGKVKTRTVKNVKQVTLMPLIQTMVPPSSVITTDESNSYNKVRSIGHLHETVNHGNGQYVQGDVHTNTIESFWSQFKRSVHGTFHAVSPKYLQTYLDEFSFRYNHRGVLIPAVMFSRVGMPAKAA
ncbi:MAG TPA: IS1595 family transposase [Rhabdochlamydiaceae bacterium]|nr:IS1595 family transposase [Rhabdochlamydiaceae bacterium]